MPTRIRVTREIKDQGRLLWLYILQLKDGCYYVGQANNPSKRLSQHFAGHGSAWTQLHRPIALVYLQQLDTTNWREALLIETEVTLKLMRQVGWQHVRGGPYTHLELQDPPALQ